MLIHMRQSAYCQNQPSSVLDRKVGHVKSLREQGRISFLWLLAEEKCLVHWNEWGMIERERINDKNEIGKTIPQRES